jgi:hypothetical protein
VSSLRSHFEQMAKPTLKSVGATLPRPTSPKPSMREFNFIESAPPSMGNQDRSRRPGSSGLANLAPPLSPTHQRLGTAMRTPSPLLSPAVTIEPPGSPPKALESNTTFPSSPSLLAADDLKTTSTVGALPPRHFRIPSRPHTPLLDQRNSPSLPVTQNPEPPPRRSGELRRDASKVSMVPPPPVNRAEKPKIPSKQLSSEAVTLTPFPSSRLPESRASPFSTPSSSDSSPEQNGPLPKNAQLSQVLTKRLSSQAPVIPFNHSPNHHSVARRKNHESYEVDNGIISSQLAGDLRDQRPTLPLRHLGSASHSSARTSIDIQRPPKKSNNFNDALRISKNETSTPWSTDNDRCFPIPPKRNFSSPASQPQTPPRTHGKSMTIDQTSGRTLPELQLAGKVPSQPNEDCNALAIERCSPVPRPTPYNLAEYPDSSLSNRRPPHPKEGPRDIPTKYDTRIFDVCGEFVCTTGHYTRIWNLRSGEQILSINHGESIKILSVSFKPAANPEYEGTQLWLGNNFGELLEVNVTSPNPIVATNNSAHTRREIIRIFRHKNELWTLDDSGTLHLWAPDNSGSLTLDSPSLSFRVPRGHAFSMIVGNKLWHAIGSDIRVFMPTLDVRAQFQVLQKPLSHPGIGNITSGAVVSRHPDQVYFGHADGKVSIYSAYSYSCLGVVNVSIYKVNSLTGVGDFLWAAYNTGMIYVYDTTQAPWLVKKDWRAHENPVINVLANKSSFWKLERLQVVSLGADNVLRLWDGLLEDDWLGESQMSLQFIEHVLTCLQRERYSLMKTDFATLNKLRPSS